MFGITFYGIDEIFYKIMSSFELNHDIAPAFFDVNLELDDFVVVKDCNENDDEQEQSKGEENFHNSGVKECARKIVTYFC